MATEDLITVAAAKHESGDLEGAVVAYGAALDADPQNAGLAYNLGIALADLGRAAEAEESYKRAIASNPNHAGAWNNLGLLRSGQGDVAQALECWKTAIRIRPDLPESHDNLGRLLLEQGKMVEAISAFQKAITLNPDVAEIHFNLGRALEAVGLADAATTAYGMALALDPDHTGANNNHGVILLHGGDFNAAADCFVRAIQHRPDLPQPWFNLGNAFRDAGKPEAAITAFGRAIALCPVYPEAFSNLSVVLMDFGRQEEAVVVLRHAIAQKPDFALAYSNLGIALSGLGRNDEAVAACRQALEISPNLAEAHANLGNIFLDLGQVGEAIAACERALELRPNNAETMASLVHLRRLACQWDDSDDVRLRQAMFRRGASIAPFILLSLDTNPAEQLEIATLWSRRFQVPPEAVFTHGDRSPEAPIRIGYLSADFHSHATAYLTADVFECHDRNRFQIFGYSYGPDDGSPMRRRLEAGFDHFIDLRTLSDAQAAQRIFDDGIDILVDLKGHTRHARTRILAGRPAPVQVAWLGYPGSMGADFIDYILADAVTLPMDQQPYYSERIVHLPQSYQCNDRHRPIAARQPTRSECGLPEDGMVFCCFNNAFKISPTTFDVWMRLLKQVPGAVLWLLAANSAAEDNLRREAETRGIAPERLVFAPRLGLAEHLARYRLADLFLDTLPYNAHTTASDALWAGLPVLTCLGASFAGRVAASLLKACGLDEMVTTSLAEYEQTALSLAHQPGALVELRRKVGEAVAQAELFHTPRFTQGLEKAYAMMWDNWRKQIQPRPFAVSVEDKMI